MNHRDNLAAKIIQLSDEELKAILTVRVEGKDQIIAIAKQEAGRRKLAIDESLIHDTKEQKEGTDWVLGLIAFLTR